MSDPFLAAFDKLSGLGATASNAEVAAALASIPDDPTPADTVQGGDDTIQAADTPADTVQGGDDTIQAADTPADTIQGGADTLPAADMPVADPPADTLPAAPATDDDEFVSRLRRLMASPPPAPQTTPVSTDAPPVYSAEEQQFLKTYETEWPDVAKAEALRRRGEYVALIQHVFTEVSTFLKPHLETLDAVATHSHFNALTTKVPDYDDVRDQVIEWAKAQPKYLQPAYQAVIERGTPDEIGDLIGRWRADTKQPAASPAATPSKPRETALPPAAIQAAAAMAPVVSKRTAPAAGIDPGDFDAAFNAAAAAADKL